MKIAVLDIGGTMIKSAIWENGILSDLGEEETRAWEGGEMLMERVLSILRQRSGFSAVGISTAGQVDIRDGSICYANENIPGYTGMKVKKRVEEEFGVWCEVENDVNAAAFGELHHGAGKGNPNFLCLTYGTGVGGAIVLEGELYRGNHFAAGSFGGLVTHPEAIVRGAEYSGCYESYASVSALVRRAKQNDPSLTDGKKIFAACERASVRWIVDAWLDEVTYGLVSLAHAFAPPVIILGGGVMEQPTVIAQIQSRFSRLVSPQLSDTIIKAAALGNRAGMIGAGILCEQANVTGAFV